MRRIIILLFILFICQVTKSQETKLITKNNDRFYEEYSVLSSNKKIKHGLYLKLDKKLFGLAFDSIGNYNNGNKNGEWETYYKYTNNIKEKGYYNNGVKDSTWIFYYSEGKDLILINSETSEGMSFQISGANPVINKKGNYKNNKETGIWEFYDYHGQLVKKFDFDNDSILYSLDRTNIDAEERFIDGDSAVFIQYLYQAFNLNDLMKRINTKIYLHPGNLKIKFIIDETAKIKDISILENTIDKKKFTERAIETIQSLENKWQPKLIGGKAQKVEKTINFKLEVDKKVNTSFDLQNNVNISTNYDFILMISTEK